MQSIEALFTYSFFLIITATIMAGYEQEGLYTEHYKAALASDAWKVFAMKTGAYDDFNETLAQQVGDEIREKTAACFSLSDECSFVMERYVIKEGSAKKVKVSFG